MEDAVLSLFKRDLRADGLRVTASPDALNRASDSIPSKLPESGLGDEGARARCCDKMMQLLM